MYSGEYLVNGVVNAVSMPVSTIRRGVDNFVAGTILQRSISLF